MRLRTRGAPSEASAKAVAMPKAKPAVKQSKVTKKGKSTIQKNVEKASGKSSVSSKVKVSKTEETKGIADPSSSYKASTANFRLLIERCK
ncbi:hypothetical protein SARC_09089 [Sphaeroforma arctica JP610]|uniref:Uncharacterized protein n=1 Tax=Sphaeroforma arctica JP610 TaxID=667725 RepID=A0A0L0FPP9_9EUKA|nr:hypothetical protein SARC_09089 [Sphaeroforma arctica JP610]KNC78486.1 hypothetical protein SARC_09089 [Sphaeroforma arctica JP610]|eukprot:XP_014152388.1 hypothetical protein SARC_09089 [Sphaeroforma arctica JP610]